MAKKSLFYLETTSNDSGQCVYTVLEFNPTFIGYTYTDFLPENCLIVLDRSHPSDGDYKKFADFINALDMPCVLFDASSNPVNVEEHHQTLIDCGVNKPFFIVSGLYKYLKSPTPNPNIKFFPFWTMWSSLQPENFSHLPKKYKVSCLNGTQWSHRILTYLALRKKSYFNEMIFSYGHRNKFDDNLTRLELIQEEFDEYSLLPKRIEFSEFDSTVGIDITTDHPAYRESYINIVTETTVNSSTPMLSEKSFKPIIAGQLFVLIASPGAVQYLRDIGFDTFDDIIDHSYDNIFDLRLRINTALDQVDKLVDSDLQSTYDQIKTRLQRNSKYLASAEFKNQFLSYLNFG